MSADQLTYSGHLVAQTCWCGIRYATPSQLDRWHGQSEKNGVYCPLGHKGVRRRTDTDIAKERAEQAERELARERSRRDQAESAARDERARTAAARAEVARTRKRATAGVCPCCSRSFQALARHMATQHPDYLTAPEPPEVRSCSLVDAVTIVTEHADEPLTPAVVHGRLVPAGRSDTETQVRNALYNAENYGRPIVRTAPSTWAQRTRHEGCEP